MENLETSWGETLPLIVEIDDSTAYSATITISDTDGTFRFAKSGLFTQVSTHPVKMKVDLSFNPQETELAIGEYNYQLRIDYTGGRVDKYPDADNCCDDCDDEADDFKFPKLIVTRSLDMPQIVS